MHDKLQFRLTPVTKKPKRTFGWGVTRFKKTDKWNFEGSYRIDQLEIPQCRPKRG